MVDHGEDALEMKPRVAILGSTGMLGHAIADSMFSDSRFETRAYFRASSDISLQFDARNIDDLSKIKDVDYVINCIGIIKQLKNIPKHEMFLVNSIFPWALLRRCEAIRAKLIHVSTDCVFSGQHGNYSELDFPDADDDYGLSKARGEPEGAMTIRTSVIGTELRNKLSLVEWAISRRDSVVAGYMNHIWNGVTTNEYASICKKIILNNLWNGGIYHIHSTSISKCELLSLINTAFSLNLTIIPQGQQPNLDRTLRSEKDLCKKLEIPDIRTMIREMKK